MSKGRDRRRRKAKAYAAVKLLAQQFPKAFRPTGPRQPLKIGISNDLASYVVVDGLQRMTALTSYTNSLNYLTAMIEGAARVDLFGQPAGVVTAKDAAFAAERLTEKLKPKPQPMAKSTKAKPKKNRPKSHGRSAG